MSDDNATEDLELTDEQLLTVLGNHGIDRRSLLALFGVGGALSLGTAAAGAQPGNPPGNGGSGPQGNARIDPYYGYSSPEDQDLSGTDLEPDHTVSLHVHEHAIFSDSPTDVPFHFAPMGLRIDPGDIVKFELDTPEHTVTAYHAGMGREQRVPDDMPPFSSPAINAGGFWLYDFESPGTYDVFCAPHEPFGMVMRLVVGDPDTNTDYDGTFAPTGRPPFSRAELTLVGIPEFPFPTPNAVLQTDALSVDNIDGPVGNSVDHHAVEADLADLPIVTKLIPMETSASSTNATFDVAWEVWDPADNLNDLTLVLIDVSSSPPGPEDSAMITSISGGSASGTTTLTASGDEDSGHRYVVQATVTDTAGNDSSSAVPTAENPMI